MPYGMGVEGARSMEFKLEIVVLPVADVDRTKAFYESIGFRLDADFGGDDGFRVVQLTPPGSACSIIFVSTADRTTSCCSGRIDTTRRFSACQS